MCTSAIVSRPDKKTPNVQKETEQNENERIQRRLLFAEEVGVRTDLMISIGKPKTVLLLDGGKGRYELAFL